MVSIIVLLVTGLPIRALYGEEGAARDDELSQLRSEVQQLLMRIDEIEKRQKAAPEPTVRAVRSKSVVVNGYTQLRFGHQGLGTGGVAPPQNFSNRRTRLALDFSLSPRVRGFLQTDWGNARPEGSGALRDMFVEFNTRGPTVRFGQMKFPMMIETDDGDLVVWPLERGLVTTRLLPDERDRGILITLRDHAKDAIPASLLLGVINGSGINQNAALDGKVFFAGAHYKKPRIEGRAWVETGDFQSTAPTAVVRGPRQRLALSARANFGELLLPKQGKYGYRWALMAAYAEGRGDFPGRNGVNAAGLLTSGSLQYTPNRVSGWYVEPVVIALTHPVPVRIIGRYERYDTNRNTGFNTIFRGFVGIAVDATEHARFILGYTPEVDQTLAAPRQRALTFETQLAF